MARKRSTNALPVFVTAKAHGYIQTLKSSRIPINRAYIFGSWAKQKADDDSDIDLAILSSSFSDWEKQNNALAKAMRMDFAGIEPHGFHPKDFTPGENLLVDEILKYGIRIV